MDEIVYNVIKTKLSQLTEQERRNIFNNINSYTDSYLSQFTLYKLNNIDLNNISLDDYIFFLLYAINRSSKDYKIEQDRIYNELIDINNRGLLTSLDIKDVIYNRRDKQNG